MLTPDEIKALAKRIEDLAFQIPPANSVTPQLVSIAIAMRNNAERDLALAYQDEREWEKGQSMEYQRAKLAEADRLESQGRVRLPSPTGHGVDEWRPAK